MKCIIPCSGFGTRMKMSKNKSKEMLPDNIFGYKHLIDYPLYICKLFNLEPLIIVRKAKKDLINYLKKNKVRYIFYEPKKGEEWWKTVLSSKNNWDQENLLLLPDTRFTPYSIIEDMKKGLELGNNAVFAVHKVNDPQNWGIIKNYCLLEKPKDLKDPEMAWGLIAFNKFEGEAIFTSMNHGYIYLENTGFVYLNNFHDITR